MSVSVHIDEAALKRYQVLAERDPARYRRKVAAAAIAGDVLLTAAQVAPLVLPIVFGVLLYPHPWLIGMAVVALIFFVWIMRPQLRTTGRPLERRQAPLLFQAVEHMCRQLQVPGRIEIHIDDAFNASAGEGRGLFGLLGTRRVLTIGMPFLACLSKADVLAVVAHELGHFSHRHGRLGNWLYRARIGWAQYAELADRPTSPLERATSWYAKRFAPHFLTLSLVHSRACEYEADREAANVVGTSQMGRALTRIELVGGPALEAFGRASRRWRQRMPEPPGDYHERLRIEIDRLLRAQGNEWLEKAIAAASSWHDTHPSLSDRLKSLDELPRIGSVDRAAGEVLLGDVWTGLVAEFDATWKRTETPSWRLDHLAHVHVEQALLDESFDAAVQGVERCLLRARFLRALDPDAGLAELRRLHELHQSDARVVFALAAALLREDDDSGVALMAAAAEADPALSEPACVRLLAHARRRSDGEGEKRWFRCWQLAVRALDASAEYALETIRAGKGQPPRLEEEVRRFLEVALGEDPSVQHAWIALANEMVSDGQGRGGRVDFHVLLLRIDTAELRAARDSEYALRDRYRDALAGMLPSNACVLVVTFFTTENLPGYVSGYSRLAGASIVSAEPVLA